MWCFHDGVAEKGSVRQLSLDQVDGAKSHKVSLMHMLCVL